MYPFYWKVLLNKTTGTSPCGVLEGLGVASSYSQAASQIENTFKDELMAILHLDLKESGQLIALPKDCCERYNNMDYPMAEFIQPADTSGNLKKGI